jgi:hypothetical protein
MLDMSVWIDALRGKTSHIVAVAQAFSELKFFEPLTI